MEPVAVLEGVYWVGAVDWDVRHFHGFTYSTHRGTTYNAYLIVDDKIVLVDTVYGPYAKEMMDRIQGIVAPEKIDYIIANHVETDHSGAIAEILKVAPILEDLKGLRPNRKIAAAFGSYGWGGGAVRTIEEILGKAGIKIVAPALTVKWVPDPNELEKCFKFGQEFAKRISENT